MEKNYTAVITQRTPRPRSKRLREMGIGSAAGATVVMSGAAGGTAITGDGHTHANLSALNEISTDTNGYQYLTQIRETEDPETGDTTVEQVTEKVKAGYADEAKDLSEDSPIREMFLSRLADDVAKGNITFEQAIRVLGLASFEQAIKVLGLASFGSDVKIRGLLRLLSGVQSDDFIDSMTAGSGWRIDENGNAQVESIEVRSYMRVLELVMNRLSAEESEFVFTESGTVETATLNEDGTYTLVMRKKTDKDITAFQVDDVLKGVVNNLAESGAVGANYYTSWMQVKEVNQTTNSIKVAVYADNDTPAKMNFPPCNLMVLHRWGSVSDTTRQSCWYISSIEKRIVMLDGVTSPILSEGNYAAFFGLPYNLSTFKGHSMNASQPYLYVRGAFLQDIHFIDYQGNVMKQERFRGTWSSAVAQGASPYIVTETTFDTVYHNNAKWQCAGSVGVAVTAEPSASSGLWIKLEEGVNGKNSIVLKCANSYPTKEMNQWITAGATYTFTVLAVDGAEVGMSLTLVIDDTTTGGYREYYGIIASVITSSKRVGFVCKGYSDNGAKGESPVIYEADFDTANFIVDENGEIKNTLTINFYKVVGNSRTAHSIKEVYASGYYPDGGLGYNQCNWNNNESQIVDSPEISHYCDDATETYKDYAYIRYDVTFVDGVVKQYVIPLVQEGQQGPQGPQGPQGASGVSVVVQYSTNATSWHSTFATGDKWMRTRMSNSSTWSSPIKIVGENGTNGSYMDYRFAISNVSETGSSTIEPTISGNWSDAPVPTTADYPYLWMRTQMMEWNASGNAYVGGTKYYTRLTGERGADGARGAILRGPTEWNAGISYAGGTVSESYQDIVVRTVDGVSEFFLCRYPNTGKDPHNTAYQSNTGPWNDTTGKYWQKSQVSDFVATKVLFAEKSKIKNLQVDDVLVYGADGTVKAEINSDRIYLDIPVQENYRTPQDESSDVYVPRALLIQGDDIHSYSMPKVKDLYNAVILPQYRDVTFGDITIKGCTQSGLHLVINAGYSDECPTWRFLAESALANLSDINRHTLWTNALFVCSDIQQFLGDYATSNVPVHNIDGENVLNNTDYIHGQMRFNGAITRFCAMLPGQTLHLISQIADYTDNRGLTHSMCVWNAINASDYEPVGAEVKRGSQSNTFPTTFDGIAPDGVDYEWSDLFFAPHQLCYNGRYYLELANAGYGTDGLFYSPGVYVFEK